MHLFQTNSLTDFKYFQCLFSSNKSKYLCFKLVSNLIFIFKIHLFFNSSYKGMILKRNEKVNKIDLDSSLEFNNGNILHSMYMFLTKIITELSNKE